MFLLPESASGSMSSGTKSKKQHLVYQVLKPNNITLLVVQWSPPVVRVAWDFNESEHAVDLHTKIIPKKLEAFRITYHPIHSK
jgi:hypothetical protein